MEAYHKKRGHVAVKIYDKYRLVDSQRKKNL